MKYTKRKLESVLAHFEEVNEYTVYLIGCFLLLASHIAYLTTFIQLGVRQMANANIFSISFYAVCVMLIRIKKLRTILLMLTLTEIMIHASLGIIYLGWNTGFALLILFIVPIPFFVTTKHIWEPYLFAAVPMVVFTLMKVFFGNPAKARYDFQDPMVKDGLYFFNAFCAAVVLLYVSSIYMFNREIFRNRILEKNETLQKLATVDPLTELFNSRAMMDFLKLIKDSSEKTGMKYVIGLGDIDDFKQVNDTYGHDCGDTTLKEISAVLADCVPSEGYISRWGGEEFLFAVPDTDLEQGRKIGENIISRVNGLKLRHPEGIFRVTMTFGVCCSSEKENYEKLISLADKRLYKGKEKGKNCVVCE